MLPSPTSAHWTASREVPCTSLALGSWSRTCKFAGLWLHWQTCTSYIHITGPPQLQATVPPPATPIGNGRPTHSNRAQHTSQLPGRSTSDYVTWSLSFSVLAEWNTLPADLLPVHPQAKALQTFNKTVFHHLGNSPELGMVRLALTIPRTFHFLLPNSCLPSIINLYTYSPFFTATLLYVTSISTPILKYVNFAFFSH